MTLLEIISEASKQIGFPVPTKVIGSTDTTVKQMLSHANTEGKELVSKYQWPQLQKEHTFTLAIVTGKPICLLASDIISSNVI